jgi:hypothetical protein
LFGYISEKNWLFVICYWLFVIFIGSEWGKCSLNRYETDIWLLIMPEARMVSTALIESLIKGNREFASILGASIRTAKPKPHQSINNQ